MVGSHQKNMAKTIMMNTMKKKRLKRRNKMMHKVLLKKKVDQVKPFSKTVISFPKSKYNKI